MEICKNKGSGYWDLTGALDIEAAEELRAALLKCFSEPGEIVINLAGVDHCDANGLQLLAAGQRTALALGRAFRLQQHSPAVTGLAQALGFQIGTVLTQGGK